MPIYKYRLNDGRTFADVLDGIESSVVGHMAKKRDLDEAGMRQLLEKDTGVRASYGRKIQRAIEMCKAMGYDPACFSY